MDCQVCPRSEASLTHKSLRTGREWPIKSAISCSDEFVIYCITCIKDTGICASSPHQYIGSTSNMAKTRLSKHIGSATLDSQADTTKPVGRHFRLPGHDSSHMKFLVFEKVFSRDRHVLEARERFWREQYDCTNNGLNVNRTWGYRSILFIFPSPFQLIFFYYTYTFFILGVLHYAPVTSHANILLTIIVIPMKCTEGFTFTFGIIFPPFLFSHGCYRCLMYLSYSLK